MSLNCMRSLTWPLMPQDGETLRVYTENLTVSEGLSSTVVSKTATIVMRLKAAHKQ